MFPQGVSHYMKSNSYYKYDACFEKLKVFEHMLLTGRLIVLLLLTGPLAAAAEPDKRVQTQASAGALRPQYLALGAELQRYLALAAAGVWPEVPAGPTIRAGAEDPRLGALAARLAMSGDLPAEETAYPYYDELLENAVRRFQARHGLATDGLVGRATLRALNTSAGQRANQIRVNLQRIRPLAEAGQRDLLLVNIAAFEATLFRQGRKVWSTRVIVGEEDDETPELRSELTSVVFNPTWSVPHSIASEELLKDIKQDPDFLARGGYGLFDRSSQAVDPETVDWSLYSENNFPFQLVQRPGPDNQLGLIKFIFPNSHSVCMHDTPARSLFANKKRALSHGCIRVDQPMVLAEHVLGAEGWSKAQVDSQTRSGTTNTVVLAQPLPLYVVYWTAAADESGRVQFYNDIYDRDADLLKRIETVQQTEEQSTRP